MDLKIKIPKSSTEIKNKVKDSIFFGNIKNVKSKNEADNFITQIKEKYHDATHNVSAYVILNNEMDNIEYYDDDGEPSKSSGPPVLETIKGKKLVNTVIVITRYFGGTQLGIGGLIRAYGGTAKKVINQGGIKELKLYYYIKVKGSYQSVGTILGQVEAFNGNIKSTKYNDKGIEVFFYLNPVKYEKLKDKLIEETGNKVYFKVKEKIYL
jgi:uncharacterized YigZ family protein